MTNELTKISRGNLENENIMSFETEKIEMTLNTESAVASGLLIQRLTELYDNPIEASVRETVSNALDAIAVVDYDGIVEIQTPNELNPVVKVKDNGVGMSEDDLINIYSKYGASTKQDNFDQVGAYGLGAKAPLAYGTEFTVTSVKNGEKTIAIVAREELTNYVKIVSSLKVDEPNGTEISIPVKNNDIEKFNDEIDKYKNSPADYSAKMIIDGEEVKNEQYLELETKVDFGNGNVARLWVNKSRLNYIIERLLIQKSTLFLNEMKYVIGGWAYSKNNFRKNSTDSAFQIELLPGLVAFNSSRDSIMINSRFDNVESAIKEHLNNNHLKEDLLNIVKEIPFKEFSEVVFSSLRMNRLQENLLIAKDGSIVAKEGYELAEDILNLEHKETGFSLKNVIDSIKKLDPENSKHLIVSGQLNSRSKTTRYITSELVSHFERNESKDLNKLTLLREKSSVLKVKNNPSGDSEFALKVLFSSILYMKKKDYAEDAIVLYYNADFSKDFNKLIKVRNEVFNSTKSQTPTHSFKSVHFVMIPNSKKEVDDFLKELELLDIELIPVDASTLDKTIEKKETDAKNAPVNNKKNVLEGYKILKLEVDKDNLKDATFKKVDADDVDANEKNVFVSNCMSYSAEDKLLELISIKINYCNVTGTKMSDVNFYHLQGPQYTAKVISSLGELGELIVPAVNSISGTTMNSKAYKSLVNLSKDGKRINENAVYLNECKQTPTEKEIRLSNVFYALRSRSINLRDEAGKKHFIDKFNTVRAKIKKTAESIGIENPTIAPIEDLILECSDYKTNGIFPLDYCRNNNSKLEVIDSNFTELMITTIFDTYRSCPTLMNENGNTYDAYDFKRVVFKLPNNHQLEKWVNEQSSIFDLEQKKYAILINMIESTINEEYKSLKAL